MARSVRFTRGEIQRLLGTAKRVLRLAACDILMAPALGKEGHLLVITPRRIGTAPQRNTVRRRLKTIFRVKNFDRAGYDCVIIVKAAGVDLSSTVLTHHLEAAFAKVGYVVVPAPSS